MAAEIQLPARGYSAMCSVRGTTSGLSGSPGTSMTRVGRGSTASYAIDTRTG
jgi:hypothetical protein